MAQVGVVLDAPRPVGAGGPQLVGVHGRVGLDLGHARRQLEQGPLRRPAGPDPADALPGDGHQMVGEDGPLLGGQLAERELTIGELATPFSMSFAGASKHVRVLENAGLVTREIRGRTHLCRLQAARLAEADAWLRRYERFWSEKLDALESLLLAEDAAKANKMNKKVKE